MIDVSQYLAEGYDEPNIENGPVLQFGTDCLSRFGAGAHRPPRDPLDLTSLDASLLEDFESDFDSDEEFSPFGSCDAAHSAYWDNREEEAMRARILQLAKEIEQEHSIEMGLKIPASKAQLRGAAAPNDLQNDDGEATIQLERGLEGPTPTPNNANNIINARNEGPTQSLAAALACQHTADWEKNIASVKQELIPEESLLKPPNENKDTSVVRAIPDTRKRRLCRHFLKGFCKRGDGCDFLHDSSIFCPDEQKIFLGGLPAHMDAPLLVQRLQELGYDVINKPKVLRGFSPQICFGTVSQAQKLIGIGKVFLDGHAVDVRPFVDKKPPDTVKKSVFLGGLPVGITASDIKQALGLLGMSVQNYPIIKAGFTPQVVLESSEDAQRLVMMKQIKIRGSIIEVRPFVNFRKRY